ncbi:hypothetical protein [Amycolatopsis vastitatis]|uniref:hypothetical protein n=1 Tax=Amycolatopsis vastitatis TaxID=1905142 RepID=UPI001303F492|nr:hypothetical protein [Amycolatopsis vastitatis]
MQETITLVALLSLLCISLLTLHVSKGQSNDSVRIKFGPFLFEYGKSQAEARQVERDNKQPTSDGDEDETPRTLEK